MPVSQAEGGAPRQIKSKYRLNVSAVFTIDLKLYVILKCKSRA